MLGSSSGRPARVLVLFSDTGGGHRSAAQAILQACHAEPTGRGEAEMVDVFRHYTPFPFNQAGPAYPAMLRYGRPLYAATFYGSNGARCASLIARVTYPMVRRGLQRLLIEHPADVLVSVHPLFNHWVNWAQAELGLSIPYVTVVTDFDTGHAAWYYPHVRRLFVPTEGARERGLRLGVPAERLFTIGLPVAPQFSAPARSREERAALRVRLGLAIEGKVVLLMGGGEGMGPLEAMARALDVGLPVSEPRTQIVVVAGRNATLRARLQATSWRHPCHAQGFLSNLDEWMAAADVLITKAGPGSITEGLLSGLPMVLMGRIPGQEDGNVNYVTSQNVGIWEPNPARATARLREWFTPGNSTLAAMAERARRLARPDAAQTVAREVLAIADSAREESTRRKAGFAAA